MKIIDKLALGILIVFPLYFLIHYSSENGFLFKSLEHNDEIRGVIQEVELRYQKTVIILKLKDKNNQEYHLLNTEENNDVFYKSICLGDSIHGTSTKIFYGKALVTEISVNDVHFSENSLIPVILENRSWIKETLILAIVFYLAGILGYFGIRKVVVDKRKK